MKNILIGLAFLLLMALVGCASPQPVKVDPSFWSRSGQKIGLAITELPTPAAHKAGDQGLLDMAINKLMAETLEGHLATVDVYRLREILAKLEEGLRQRGQIPVRLKTVKKDRLVDFKAPNGATGFSKKDLRGLIGSEPVDAVLLVNVVAVGTIRSYYGFIPTSAPAGYVLTENNMVNAVDNKLIWSAYVKSTQPVQGEWDEPPRYTNVDRAIDVAVTQVSSSVAENLFSSP